MALSKLSGDEQGIILGQLRNTLEPRLVMYFSSASKELRALLPPAVVQQLRTDYEEATALCLKMGMRSCRELRKAKEVRWTRKGLSAADLAKLATLASVLPALKYLTLAEHSAGPDGVPQLAEGLVAGALPAVTRLSISDMRVGEAGASALARALDRGALPRLRCLSLYRTAIGDAALAALAPALRRLPALESLQLGENPLGDEGLAALVAPAPPAGTPPPPAGGLKKLKVLDLSDTQTTDAGCATLVAALDSGALPALEKLHLRGIRASALLDVLDALDAALARSRAAALCLKVGMRGCKELREAKDVVWRDKGLSAADLATLATLGSVLPALKYLTLAEHSGSAGRDGVQRLAKGLVEGALPALISLTISSMHVGDAGAKALARALDRGALPRLRGLFLTKAAISDAALVALAPALRRRPALEHLQLSCNPLGDKGLAALVAPPPYRGLQLKVLDLVDTQITDAGCATLATAFDSGVLLALDELKLDGIPASVAARHAVLMKF